MPLTRRRNGYLKAVSYTALLDARALLASRRLRRCSHVMEPMIDGPVCVVCGQWYPWRRGEGNSDDED